MGNLPINTHKLITSIIFLQSPWLWNNYLSTAFRISRTKRRGLVRKNILPNLAYNIGCTGWSIDEYEKQLKHKYVVIFLKHVYIYKHTTHTTTNWRNNYTITKSVRSRKEIGRQLSPLGSLHYTSSLGETI